jgi:hypothetical protein
LLSFMLDRLGRRLSKGGGTVPWSLGRRLLPSKGPVFNVFILFMTFSPALLLTDGLLGSDIHGNRSDPILLSCRELPREGALSLGVGVFLPFAVPGLLPLPLLFGVGNAGKAQSKPADSSGLGGLGSNRRGAGLVMLRIGGGGRLPLLLPDRTLTAGDKGDCDPGGRGARKGWFATSALIRGGAVREGFGAGIWREVMVGARTLV